MDEFDETMQDIKENLIARIQRQEQEIENLNKKLEEQRHFYLEEIERLNNIIEILKYEIRSTCTNLSNNLNVNYMHEALQKDLLNILQGDK